MDDYASMARAGLTLFETVGDRRYLVQTEAWVHLVIDHFSDGSGGYFLTADDTENLIVRTRSVSDAAVPSGNGLLIEVFSRLYALTGNAAYRDYADALIAAFSGELRRDSFSLGTYLNGVDFHRRQLQIVIAGNREAEDTGSLLRAINVVSLPNRVVTVITGDGALPPLHPAFGKGLVGGQATAYICEGQVCSLPITDSVQLITELRTR